MPSTYKIPARTERRCEPCEHLKRENMLCSRLHGISFDYVCMHPERWTEWDARHPGAKLPKPDMPRMIERDDNQPDWCPLKGEPANGLHERPGENT